MGENIHMLPSDMNLKLKTGTVGIITKFSIYEKFSLGKYDKVNSLEVPVMRSPQTDDSNEVQAQKPTIAHKNQEPQTITHIGHNEEKIALVLFLASGFAI